MNYDGLFFFLAILPKDWRRYTVPEGLTVIQWIADFSDRVQQLQHVSKVAQTGTTQGLKVSVTNTRTIQKFQLFRCRDENARV